MIKITSKKETKAQNCYVIKMPNLDLNRTQLNLKVLIL